MHGRFLGANVLKDSARAAKVKPTQAVKVSKVRTRTGSPVGLCGGLSWAQLGLFGLSRAIWA